MGIFNEKQHISKQYAQIGEDASNGDIIWTDIDSDYAWAQYNGGVFLYRGYVTINGICYNRFYLPPPPHLRQYEQ